MTPAAGAPLPASADLGLEPAALHEGLIRPRMLFGVAERMAVGEGVLLVLLLYGLPGGILGRVLVVPPVLAVVHLLLAAATRRDPLILDKLRRSLWEPRVLIPQPTVASRRVPVHPSIL